MPGDIFRKLRDAVRAAAPGAVEAFSYGIPGFRLGGQQLVSYAAWKHHSSLYPMTAVVLRPFTTEIKGQATRPGPCRRVAQEGKQ